MDVEFDFKFGIVQLLRMLLGTPVRVGWEVLDTKCRRHRLTISVGGRIADERVLSVDGHGGALDAFDDKRSLN